MNKFQVGQWVAATANINGDIVALSGVVTRAFEFGSKAVPFVTIALEREGPAGFGSVSVPESRVILSRDV